MFAYEPKSVKIHSKKHFFLQKK